jgi:hypothetical protein
MAGFAMFSLKDPSLLAFDYRLGNVAECAARLKEKAQSYTAFLYGKKVSA